MPIIRVKHTLVGDYFLRIVGNDLKKSFIGTRFQDSGSPRLITVTPSSPVNWRNFLCTPSQYARPGGTSFQSKARFSAFAAKKYWPASMSSRSLRQRFLVSVGIRALSTCIADKRIKVIAQNLDREGPGDELVRAKIAACPDLVLAWGCAHGDER